MTLIEARITEASSTQVVGEIYGCGQGNLATLHITSWDCDHCDPAELSVILNVLKPKRIEYPGYPPHTDEARKALRMIEAYQAEQKIAWSPPTITGLTHAEAWGRSNILYWPKLVSSNSNDNSTVKLFRSGEFTVLSLGDVESVEIADRLVGCGILCREVDVIILAHHGADNGFTTTELIQCIRPRVAICSSNYDNQFEHPRQEIRDILFECGVPIFTTKTGDVIIESLQGGGFRVTNLIGNCTEVSSTQDFACKRTGLMRAFAAL